MNSVHRSCYIAGVSFFGVPGAVVAVLASRWRGEGHSAASLSFLAILYSSGVVAVLHFPLLCFLPVTLLISGEPVPSLSCSAIVDKLAPAPPTPCASSYPLNLV